MTGSAALVKLYEDLLLFLVFLLKHFSTGTSCGFSSWSIHRPFFCPGFLSPRAPKRPPTSPVAAGESDFDLKWLDTVGSRLPRPAPPPFPLRSSARGGTSDLHTHTPTHTHTCAQRQWSTIGRDPKRSTSRFESRDRKTGALASSLSSLSPAATFNFQRGGHPRCMDARSPHKGRE